MATGLAVVAVPFATKAYERKKQIEFVVMAGKGGGADRAGRFMQSIISKNKLASQPVTPLKKLGGSGAEALVYLKGDKASAHTIMFTPNSFYTTPLRKLRLGVDIAPFRPVMRIAKTHSDSG